MKIGCDIKMNFSNCNNGCDYDIPNFVEDSHMMCSELYAVLKDFCPLPKLRKENLHIESSLNTIHQTYMYDFLYDQQDIYDHYNEVFETRSSSLDSTITVRQPYQPFSLALENIDSILLQFSDDNDNYNLASIRWYTYNGILETYQHEKFSSKNSNFQGEILSYKSYNSTNAFTHINNSGNFNLNSNKLLLLLNSFTLTINFFCKLSYDYINEYSHEDQFFFDSFLKIYKAYVTAAIHINENYENLNVLVNYLYEGIFKESPKTPKFSIYRLMLVNWHRLVTIPLSDLNKEKNLIGTSLKLFKSFILNEFEKSNGENEFRYYKSRSNPPETFGAMKSLEFDNLSDDEDSYANRIDINHGNLNINLGFEYMKSGENMKYDLDINSEVSSDMKALYFLEGIPSALLDITANEYSTFHLNDSNFEISNLYQIYEKNMIKLTEKFIKTKLTKVDALSLLNYIRNSQYFSSKLINRTKKEIIHSVSSIILNHCELGITQLFVNFLNSYTFNNEDSIRDREMFFRAFDLTEERNNMFYFAFYKISFDKFGDQLIAEYAVLYFLRELIKFKNKAYYTLTETLKWIDEEKENKDYIDKHVRKEIKRRNVTLKDNEDYEEQLYSFNTNLSLSHILEIFQKNVSNHTVGLLGKEKGIFTSSKSIGDLPTLPQSMDIDMKLEDNMMEVDYENSNHRYLVSLNSECK